MAELWDKETRTWRLFRSCDDAWKTRRLFRSCDAVINSTLITQYIQMDTLLETLQNRRAVFPMHTRLVLHIPRLATKDILPVNTLPIFSQYVKYRDRATSRYIQLQQILYNDTKDIL